MISNGREEDGGPESPRRMKETRMKSSNRPSQVQQPPRLDLITCGAFPLAAASRIITCEDFHCERAVYILWTATLSAQS
jgi:hypothetical protein